MSPARAGRRSGITLTEILIAILIMGIGLISLATLFPLGLIRLREAARQSRSGYLAESASGDMAGKNLLLESTFSNSWYGFALNPFIQDVDPNGNVTLVAFTPGIALPASPFPLGTVKNPITGGPILDPYWIPVLNPSGHTAGGLPICYDPLWYSQTGVKPVLGAYNPYLATIPNGYFQYIPTNEVRFGASAIVGAGGTVIANLKGGLNGSNGGYGLQRITNFVPWVAPGGGSPGTSLWPFTYPVPGSGAPATVRDVAADTFVSPEDQVMQGEASGQSVLLAAPGDNQGFAGSVVPEIYATTPPNALTTFSANAQGNATTLFQPQNDLRYTWMFTGRQIDTSQGNVFEGDIVVMDARPFAFEPVTDPGGKTAYVPAGETTVDAIFGYSTQTALGLVAAPVGYGTVSDRTVLLRWPDTIPDPEIRIGGWIADTTYERVQATADFFFNTTAIALVNSGSSVYPLQRCHWYQVAKKGDVTSGAGYRQLILYTTSQLKSKTLLNSGGTAVFPNTALIMPSVINAFPRVFYVR